MKTIINGDVLKYILPENLDLATLRIKCQKHSAKQENQPIELKNLVIKEQKGPAVSR